MKKDLGVKWAPEGGPIFLSADLGLSNGDVCSVVRLLGGLSEIMEIWKMSEINLKLSEIILSRTSRR